MHTTYNTNAYFGIQKGVHNYKFGRLGEIVTIFAKWLSRSHSHNQVLYIHFE